MRLFNRFAPLPMFLMAPDDAAAAGAGAGAGAAGDGAAAGAADGGAAAAAGADAGKAAAADAGKGAADAGAGKTAPDAGKAAAGADGALAAGDDKGAVAAAAAAKTPADWPADWREKMAGDDKGFLNVLKRYGTPLDAANWIRTTQLKISAGELKAKSEPPKDGKPEEIAAWRKEQGLPEKPEDYVSNLKLADGIVPGEADKPLLEVVAKLAHGKNYSQDVVNDFVGVYYEIEAGLKEQRLEHDQTNLAQARQQLEQTMGADFAPNMNALKVFWADRPPEVQATILQARAPDGRVVGDIPEVVSFLAQISRELNPAAAILPAGSGSDLKALSTRKTEIEKMMYTPEGKQNPDYWRNDKVRSEYRDIITAEEQLAKREKATG